MNKTIMFLIVCLMILGVNIYKTGKQVIMQNINANITYFNNIIK